MSQADLEQPPEAHWSLYDVSARDEGSEIVAQFLTPYTYQNDDVQGQGHQELAPSMFWPHHAGNSTSSACFWSQGDSNSRSTRASNSSYIPPPPPHDVHYGSYYLSDPDVSLGINTLSAPIDLNLVEEEQRSNSIHLVPSPSFVDQTDYLDGDNGGGSDRSAPSHRKKRPRASAQKQAKKAGSKRPRKSSDEGESRSSCYCSDDESNSGGAAAPPGNAGDAKIRAWRGSATDPQSLYARRRRERINERLRMLQHLVPSGTKVDISTMLEEAVQYVKSLQLQIKLLSSDELWMYAPIAYNGFNIGIDLKISPPQ